jgi:hypothetical protein
MPGSWADRRSNMTWREFKCALKAHKVEDAIIWAININPFGDEIVVQVDDYGNPTIFNTHDYMLRSLMFK